MRITCKNVGKRYQFNWIVRNCNWVFDHQKIYGISGPNGSGKSTIIKILSTSLSPSEGSVEYLTSGNKNAHHLEVIKSLSLVAPYTSLIQEFTLAEQYDYHFKFKKKRFDFEAHDFGDLLEYDGFKDKSISGYSSGMQQRLQLGLAVLSDTSILLLDEPTSFLDHAGKEWFYRLLNNYKDGRVIVLASNDADDLALCETVYNMQALG